MTAFVDTSALFALLVADDDTHAETAAEFTRLLKAGASLWVTSYVVVETIALLQRRVGMPVVHDLEERILPVLSVFWVTEGLHRRGMTRLLRENRRQLSLVDCVSLEFMQTEGLRDVFGLDAHFAEAGHRLLPRSRTE